MPEPGSLALLALGAVGLGGYRAGPLLCAVACGLSSTTLTLAGMILWPLCRLARDNSA
jgi:hypothetical protein